YGAAVFSALSIATSADAEAVPLLPVESVLLPGIGSNSVALTVVLLSNVPVVVIVAVTVIVSVTPLARDGIVHGSAEQFVLLTLVMLRCVGVSVTRTFVAVDGPLLVTAIV